MSYKGAWIWIVVPALALILGACSPKEKAPVAPASASKAAPKASEAPPVGPVVAPDFAELVVGGRESEVELPMIIAVHGLGDRPESFGKLLQPLKHHARVILPRGYKPYGGGFSWFEIERGAGGLSAPGLNAAADGIAKLVERLIKERPTRGKPVLLGFSQGGMLSLALATRHPQLFQAVFPLAGVLPNPPASIDPKGLPKIVAFHGAIDKRLPPKSTEALIKGWKAGGAPVEMKLYPKVGHHLTGEIRTDLYSAIGEVIAPQ